MKRKTFRDRQAGRNRQVGTEETQIPLEGTNKDRKIKTNKQRKIESWRQKRDIWKVTMKDGEIKVKTEERQKIGTGRDRQIETVR